jgi:multidrug resistance efflux pump
LEYRKLVAERTLATAEMDIVARREVLAARQRTAEREQLAAEVQLLQQEVAALQSGMQALNVSAPRAGVVLHLSNWQGEKFDVGSQIFRGQAVAQIPDLSQLAVRMQVPERQLGAVRAGQRVSVNVEGGALPTLTGSVQTIGRVVRSRSRVSPVPVVDVNVRLDALPPGAKLKPGQPVRVDLQPETSR